MTREAAKLLEKALALSENERAELAGTLIASLESVVDEDVEVAWQREIARRAEQVRRGEISTVPWDEVQQKARSIIHER